MAGSRDARESSTPAKTKAWKPMKSSGSVWDCTQIATASRTETSSAWITLPTDWRRFSRTSWPIRSGPAVRSETSSPPPRDERARSGALVGCAAPVCERPRTGWRRSPSGEPSPRTPPGPPDEGGPLGDDSHSGELDVAHRGRHDGRIAVVQVAQLVEITWPEDLGAAGVPVLRPVAEGDDVGLVAVAPEVVLLGLADPKGVQHQAGSGRDVDGEPVVVYPRPGLSLVPPTRVHPSVVPTQNTSR